MCNFTGSEIISFTSVIASTSISLLTLYQNYRLKKIDSFHIAKREALINFSNAVTLYSEKFHTTERNNYLTSLNNLVVFFHITQEEIDKIENINEPKLLLKESNKLIRKLSKQIKF